MLSTSPLLPSRQPLELRSHRRHPTRAVTLALRKLRHWYRRRLPVVYPTDVDRPKTRADCATGPRPCPWVSCKHHLYLDVKSNGSIKLNFPDLEPHELPFSCALDVAEVGGLGVERTARVMNLTRERLRQIESELLEKIRDAAIEGELPAAHALLELWED